MTEGGGYGPYAYSDSPAGPTGRGGYGGGYGFPPPPPPKRRGGGMLSHLAVAVLAAAVGVGATLALYSPDNSSSSISSQALPGAGAVPQPGSGSGSGGSANQQSILNKVEPGMVIINSSLQYSSEAGAGSGMIINSNGLVLTNNHVIEDSTKLSATVVSTGKTYPATVVGYDKTGDIGLIKLQGASGLNTVPLGNSSSVKVGDQVVALGNAEGQGTVVPAAGQIVGINQTITASDQGGSITSETLHGMLKTNANIVSGDSGGPLANASGQVVGMDTAGDSVSMGQQQSAGSGFAIPINTALSVARKIAAGHASSTISIGYPPFIGVFIASGTNPNPQQQAAQQQQSQNGNPFGGSGSGGGGFGNGGGQGGLGSGNGTGTGNGFGQQQPSCYTSNASLQIPQTIAPVSAGTLVDGVICGSPAAQAGLSGGAVITRINDQAAGAPQHLSGILAKLKPGQDVSITWVSPQGKQTTSSLHLVQGPPQ